MLALLIVWNKTSSNAATIGQTHAIESINAISFILTLTTMVQISHVISVFYLKNHLSQQKERVGDKIAKLWELELYEEAVQHYYHELKLEKQS